MRWFQERAASVRVTEDEMNKVRELARLLDELGARASGEGVAALSLALKSAKDKIDLAMPLMRPPARPAPRAASRK